MTAKRKFIITLSVLCVTFIVSMIALIFVLVASVQKASATISVKFKATDVSVNLSSNYIVGGVTKPMYVFENGEVTDDTELVFSPTTEITGVLAPKLEEDEDSIILDKQNQIVVFEFVFENLSTNLVEITHTDTEDAGGNPLLMLPLATGMNVRYYVTDTKVADLSTITASDSTLSKALNATTGITEDMIIAGESTTYIYIVANIANLLYDASYEGDFGWTLARFVESA